MYFSRKNAPVLHVLFIVLMASHANAQRSDGGTLSVKRNKIDNTPVSITFSPAAGWRESEVNEIFRRYLGADNVNSKLELKNVTTTKSKVTTRRYTQHYKDIPVAYGTYAVVSRNGIVSYMSGNYYNVAVDLTTKPTLTEQAAFSRALSFVNADRYMWQSPAAEKRIKARYRKDTTYLPKGALVWMENRRQATMDRKLHLAYSFDIYAEVPMSRQQVYVDAQTGEVLFSNQLIQHVATTGQTLYSGIVPINTSFVDTTYILFDSTRGSGIYTLNAHNDTVSTTATDFTSATNHWLSSAGDTQAIDAHWGAAVVYDYWKAEQSRLSWDGFDGPLVSFVHIANKKTHGGPLNNAFWNGSEMSYGDGSGSSAGGFDPLVSLDVVAHEIGHGVCQSTADLVYEGESGALNEAFSDCWGATIEHWANMHETDAIAKNAWYIGEEIRNGNPLRRMDQPKVKNQPDTYLETFWYPVVGCIPDGSPTGNDNCGVHTNSGVMNKWYYLITNGGSGSNDLGNSYTISGLGWDTAAAILYQTELSLYPFAGYYECRDASSNAVVALFGMCSPQQEIVENAWYAVGVGPEYVPCSGAAVQHTAKQAEAFTAIPNPSNGTFTIYGHITSAVNEPVTMVVSDMLGRVVYDKTIDISGNDLVHTINLQSVASGRYLVTITTSSAHHVVNIVVGK